MLPIRDGFGWGAFLPGLWYRGPSTGDIGGVAAGGGGGGGDVFAVCHVVAAGRDSGGSRGVSYLALG